MSVKKTEITVLGGGVIGLSVALRMLNAGREVTYVEVEADQGHDAFLLPIPRYINALKGYLYRVHEEENCNAP